MHPEENRIKDTTGIILIKLAPLLDFLLDVICLLLQRSSELFPVNLTRGYEVLAISLLVIRTNDKGCVVDYDHQHGRHPLHYFGELSVVKRDMDQLVQQD